MLQLDPGCHIQYIYDTILTPLVPSNWLVFHGVSCEPNHYVLLKYSPGKPTTDTSCFSWESIEDIVSIYSKFSIVYAVTSFGISTV